MMRVGEDFFAQTRHNRTIVCDSQYQKTKDTLTELSKFFTK